MFSRREASKIEGAIQESRSSRPLIFNSNLDNLCPELKGGVPMDEGRDDNSETQEGKDILRTCWTTNDESDTGT